MNGIKLKKVNMEDFANYKVPSMFLITCFCDWKCCTEANIPSSICQNNSIASLPNKEYSFESIYQAYVKSPITKAVVIGGLEPMLQFEEIIDLIDYFRSRNEHSPFVIYTGYYPNEISYKISKLKQYENIIVKFGRFKPNEQKHFDSILGVDLASNNQYANIIN